jgi:hypothetical protein
LCGCSGQNRQGRCQVFGCFGRNGNAASFLQFLGGFSICPAQEHINSWGVRSVRQQRGESGKQRRGTTMSYSQFSGFWEFFVFLKVFHDIDTVFQDPEIILKYL